MDTKEPCERCGKPTSIGAQPCLVCWPPVDPCEELRAENAALRESIRYILTGGWMVYAQARAYEEAVKHGIPLD